MRQRVSLYSKWSSAITIRIGINNLHFQEKSYLSGSRCAIQRVLYMGLFREEMAAPDRTEDQLGNAVDPQLFHDASSMGFHRVEAQVQARRNLFVRLALGEEVIELPFPTGQKLIPVFSLSRPSSQELALLKRSQERRVEIRSTFVQHMYGVNQTLFHGVLQHVTPRTGLDGPHYVALVRMHAEDEYRGLRRLPNQLRGGFDTIQLFHSDVHYRDIRFELPCQFDRLQP